MKAFSERLDEALRIRKVSAAELSKKLGLNEGTISNYRAGRYSPKQDRIEQIANALDVNIAWLLGADVPMRKPQPKHFVAVLGSVRAGVPIEAVEDILGYEEISEDMARLGEYFALRIQGNSMSPKFSEGDIAIVRQQSDVESGDIAIVLSANIRQNICTKVLLYGLFLFFANKKRGEHFCSPRFRSDAFASYLVAII